jgi:hypothetical protein
VPVFHLRNTCLAGRYAAEMPLTALQGALGDITCARCSRALNNRGSVPRGLVTTGRACAIRGEPDPPRAGLVRAHHQSQRGSWVLGRLAELRTRRQLTTSLRARKMATWR